MTFLSYLSESFKLGCASQITRQWLQDREISALVFDVDGVLSSDQQIEPLPELKLTIERLQQYFPVAIYSNANHPKRQRYYTQTFANIHWIQTPPKKPAAKPLVQLSKIWKIDPSKILMIDDRLLTGGLAAYRAQYKFLLITQPKFCLRTAPLYSLFFIVVRFFERLLVKVVNFR